MDELLNFVEKSLSTAVGGKDCPQPRCSARGLRGSPGADGSPAFPLRRFPGLGVTVPSAAVVTGNTLVFSFHASLVLVSDAGISLIFLFFQLFIFHLPNVLPYHLVLLYLSLVLISGSCLLLWYLVDIWFASIYLPICMEKCAGSSPFHDFLSNPIWHWEGLSFTLSRYFSKWHQRLAYASV